MTKLLRWVVGSAVIACGPAQGGDESAGSGGGTEETGGLPTSGGATGETGTSGEPGTSTTSDESETAGSTGAPVPICPEGQASKSLQWQRDIEEEGDIFDVVRGAVSTPDGRITLGIGALKQTTWQIGVQLLSSFGEPVAVAGTLTPTSDDVSARALTVRGDNTAVMVGSRSDDAGDHGWIAVVDPDGPSGQMHDLSLTAMNMPNAVVHTQGRTTVVAFDKVGLSVWVGGFVAESGAATWAVELPGRLRTTLMAAGPDGEVVVVRGSWDSEPESDSELRAWRFDGAGGIVWDRTFTPDGQGLGVLGGLTITPDGQVVVIESWTEVGQVFVTSLGLADGAMGWRTQIFAGNDEKGEARPGGVVATTDGVEVLIGQTDGTFTLPISATLHAVSTTGVAGAVTELEMPDRNGSSLTTLTRGPCGDLLVMFGDAPTWLGSFAP